MHMYMLIYNYNCNNCDTSASSSNENVRLKKNHDFRFHIFLSVYYKLTNKQQRAKTLNFIHERQEKHNDA